MPIKRIINAGGIPQQNAMLNQIYADVLNKPVLVPDGVPTSLGSGIFALLATGSFKSIEEAQAAMCLPHRTFTPNPESAATYDQIFPLYRNVYFGLGTAEASPVSLGKVLPELKRIAARVGDRSSSF